MESFKEISLKDESKDLQYSNGKMVVLIKANSRMIKCKGMDSYVQGIQVMKEISSKESFMEKVFGKETTKIIKVPSV